MLLKFWAMVREGNILSESSFGGAGDNVPKLFPTRKIARLEKISWGYGPDVKIVKVSMFQRIYLDWRMTWADPP